MLKYIGKDASEIFNMYHNQQLLRKFKNLVIGKINPKSAK